MEAMPHPNRGWLQRNGKPLFYALWLSVALMHAGFSGLLDDEAYYWMYARYPDWGYFDHPPMIAAVIRAGYALFPNALGVRLIVVLMSTATLLGIDRLLEKRDDGLFYMTALSLGVLQIGGISEQGTLRWRQPRGQQESVRRHGRFGEPLCDRQCMGPQSVAPAPEYSQQYTEPPGHELVGRDLEVSGRKCRINARVLAEHGAHHARIDFDTQSRLQALPSL